MKKMTLLSLGWVLLFLLPSLAGNSQQTGCEADAIKAQLILDWQRAKVFTKSYIDAMPDDQLGFKPSPEIRSFAEQMLHLAYANAFFVSNATFMENPFKGQELEKNEELKSNKAALIQTVMNSYDYVIHAIKALDSRELFEKVISKGAEKNLSRMAWINKGFEHQTHERGQCTIYLRLKGIEPPSELLF